MKRKTVAMILVIIALAAAIGAVVLYIGVKTGLGAVPMTPAPTISTPSSTPTHVRLPKVTPAPTPATPIPIADIDGVPVHITATQAGQPLIDADITPIQLDDGGMLVPPNGQAGWYGPPQWNTVPGNLSTYSGIVVGHDITDTGAKDTFYNLGLVKKGDTVEIIYKLKDGTLAVAEFVVTEDAKVVSKVDVITEAQTTYRWVWYSDTLERIVSIFSCDLAAPQVNGHSVDNWVVQAIRVK